MSNNFNKDFMSNLFDDCEKNKIKLYPKTPISLSLSLSLSLTDCVNMNILLKTRVAVALCYSCFPGPGTDGAPPDSE